MTHQYKVEKWQSGSGKWYCNDVAYLNDVSSKWWVAPRILGMSLPDYILLLKNEYNANIVSYNPDADVLVFNWDSGRDCERYIHFINAAARSCNYLFTFGHN